MAARDMKNNRAVAKPEKPTLPDLYHEKLLYFLSKTKYKINTTAIDTKFNKVDIEYLLANSVNNKIP